MNSNNCTVRLAFLLALSDLDTPLNDEEQTTLGEVARQLKVNPSAWSKYTEPLLLEIINANDQLHQQYDQYKSQLDNCGLLELIPTLRAAEQEISDLIHINFGVKPKAPPPKKPVDYEQDLKNVVVLNEVVKDLFVDVTLVKEPEKMLNSSSLYHRLKQFLSEINPNKKRLSVSI